MISNLIALPYKLARTPLVLIDNTLSERLPETSLPRVTLDRVIGSSDKFAGALLGDPDIAGRGADRIERSDTLRKAGKLEQEAETRREQAQQTVADGHEEAAQKREAAEDRASKSLDEADAAEARAKREASVKAKKAAAAKKATADQKAANRKTTIEQRKQRVDSAAEAKKKNAQREAKAKIDDARKADQSAAKSRTDAERLNDLTEVKKQKRKQG
jgi:hypothetical protein